MPHGLTGRDSSVWFKVQHFLWRKKNKIILFAYLIIAFGLCQKTQSSAKYQKNPKSINVFVKCQNPEQHVVRNNINLRVVRNSTFSVEKKNTVWIRGPFNNYVDKMRGEGAEKYLLLSTLSV